MSEKLLDKINYPADLRLLKKNQLEQVAKELRSEVINVVSETGGHLGAGLGVVELTIALHYVFNTPKDKLVWDVGHQCYPHKIITGRKDRIRTLRKGGGLSGFTKRSESEYDPFGAAHSSTSISSALGIAVANKLSNKSDNVIAVIGDGAMSAGMAYEAMNNAGSSKTKMIIINSPHNPSGMLFSKDDMLELQDLAEKNDLLVLSDEVYEHIIFDGNVHQSASKFEALAERSFVTASFGKTFHNTGWKMGYCAAPEKLMKEFQKVHQFVVFCVNHPIQKALATYLKDKNHYWKLSDFYQQKRDFFLHLMEGSNFKIVPSKGTYFQMLDFTEISNENDIAFAEWLTKEHKIATIPTSVFNEGRKDFKQIRVCFAKTDETLAEAAKILREL